MLRQKTNPEHVMLSIAGKVKQWIRVNGFDSCSFTLLTSYCGQFFGNIHIIIIIYRIICSLSFVYMHIGFACNRQLLGMVRGGLCVLDDSMDAIKLRYYLCVGSDPQTCQMPIGSTLRLFNVLKKNVLIWKSNFRFFRLVRD